LTQLTGDVTAGPGSGSVAATIANDAVTFAKMQNLSGASRLLGRGASGGAGDIEEVTLSGGMSMTGTVLNGPRNSVLINYTYNTGPEPPNAGQLRTDLGFPFTATTKLWIRFVSVDDQDVYWGLMVISLGSTILVQDKDDHASYARFRTTGPPIDKTTYAEIPVAWVANGSSIITAQQVLVQVSAVSAPGGDTTTTIVSSATPTPAGGSPRNFFTVTALAAAAAFAAPSGTPTEGNYLTIRIKSDATARALSWNAIYRAGTDVALPTTTTASKTLYLGFRYNASDSTWDLLAVTNGF